ncbi:hypothetical protein [Streptomyces sp. NPDC012888]|uniref:hypothetical protein n=1 Tax=Streptomyces sp. NPDC012888 TaxID=3364855 RepID=UPI003688958F
MSEIADTPVTGPAPAVPRVHEAYSFACMRCGYGWEQGYEIEHHTDAHGQPFIVYTVAGERVPSPLSNPTCLNCGGHVVRIMREGQVSSVLGTLDRLYHYSRIAPGIAGPVPATAAGHSEHERRGRHRAGRTGSGERLTAGAPGAVPHDSPGPVRVTPEDRGEGRGLRARLRSWLGRS